MTDELGLGLRESFVLGLSINSTNTDNGRFYWQHCQGRGRGQLVMPVFVRAVQEAWGLGNTTPEAFGALVSVTLRDPA